MGKGKVTGQREPMIPNVDFFGTPVSRVALGDNPFCGHSYIQEVHSGDEMVDFYSEANCVRTLFEAQEQGVNTYVALADPFILRVIRQYRIAGGSMNIIFQSYPPVDLSVNLQMMMKCNPIGIYHQGGTADFMVESEQAEQLRDRLKMIRNAGVPAGLGTHEPETLLRAENEDWGADFYMTCLYNARKSQRGEQSGFITGKPKELVFFPDDRFQMFDAIRRVRKPCIAFKIFAGGQMFCGKPPEQFPAIIETAFRETYENIKPIDFACIGVFQKCRDELREDLDIVKKILGLVKK